MTASSAVLGYNIDFAIYNGTTYTNVAEVTDITWPGYSRDAVEVTNMESPNKFREYIAGLMDGGEVTLELNWVPAATNTVLTALLDDDLGQFKITYNAGANVIITGIVTAYQPKSPLGEKLSASATIKVSGKPTWAAS